MKYMKRLNESGEYGRNNRSKKQLKIDLKVGDFYECKKTYKEKFIMGDEYELLGIGTGVVVMRYYRDEKPVRFRMTKETFNSTFKVPNKPQVVPNGISAFDEEWDNIPQYIYKVGTGRDFDLEGYVVAEDSEMAKEKAIEMEMVTTDMVKFLRVSKVLDKHHSGELRRRKMEAGKTYTIYKHLNKAIEDWKKTNED